MDEAASTVEAPPAEQAGPARISRGRRILVWVLIALAAVIALAGSLTVFVKKQILDTDTWVSLSSSMLENEDIRNALSLRLVNELYANVNVEERIQERLPSQFSGLAAPISAALRNTAETAANRLLASEEAQAVWADINRRAHAQLVDVLEGREGKAVTTANGEVVLDVRQLLQQLGDRLNLNLGTRIPEGAGQIVILDSDRLAAVQKAVRVIKVMTVFLVLVAFALIAGAVYLARGRRRETLRAAGIALLLVGIIDLVVRRLVGYEIVDALSNPTNESAVSATWDITSSLIVDVAIALIALGILGIVAAWIAGPTRPALWIRRKLAPTLRNRPVLVYAVVALALLLWLLFGPTQAVRSLIGTGIFIILVVVGVEVLRRQTAREFPAEPLAAEPVAAAPVAVPATPEPTGREPEETK